MGALALTLALPLVQSLLLQRYLTPADFGALVTVGAATTLLAGVFTGSDRPRVLRIAGEAAPAAAAETFARLRRSFLPRTAVAIALWACVCVALKLDGRTMAGFVAGAALLVAACVTQVHLDVGSARREPLPGVTRVGMVRLGAVLALGTMGAAWGLGLWDVAWILAITHVTSAALVWWWVSRRLLRRETDAPVTVDWRALLRDGAPFATLSVISSIYIQSDVILLSWMRDLEEVSAYGRAFSICPLATAAYVPIQLYYGSRIARARTEGQAAFSQVLNTWTRVTVVAVCAGTLGAAAFGLFVLPQIAPIDDLTRRLIPIILSGWLLYYLPPYGDSFHHVGRMRPVLIGSIVAASLNATLNLAFIPMGGAVAAAWTTLASYIVLRSYYAFVVSRDPELRINTHTWVFVACVATPTLAALIGLGRL